MKCTMKSLLKCWEMLMGMIYEEVLRPCNQVPNFSVTLRAEAPYQHYYDHQVYIRWACPNSSPGGKPCYKALMEHRGWCLLETMLIY